MANTDARLRTLRHHPAQLFITFSVILSILVTACGGDVAVPEAAPAEVEPTAAPVTEEAAPTEVVEEEAAPAAEPTAVKVNAGPALFLLMVCPSILVSIPPWPQLVAKWTR